METKKILGLDLGTNSIGAAVINMPKHIIDFGKEGSIEWVGSRIVPVDAQYLNKWEAGSKTETKAAARRIKRGARRLKQRYKLRRKRLIQVFKTLGWLNEGFPENFKEEIRKDNSFKFQISDYLPFEESTIYEATKLLGVTNKKGELALPEDWIIYYLRKKALTEKISIAELCRITYMMNQRRGFKSSRKDLKDESIEERKWVEKLKIKSITQVTTELNKNRNYKFEITSYNDNIKPWTVEKKKKPEWEEKEFTFLITEKIETKSDGTKKITQNNPQIPKEGDWALCVTAQDNQIGSEYPGVYFFNGLVNSVKNKSDFKIRQYAVYRKKYKKELEDIWKKQIELNEDLQKINSDKSILEKLAGILYPTQTKANKPKLAEITGKDLLHLISNDIIYYQRDLKSQNSSRGECQYEKVKGKDGIKYGIKCSPKSSPEFQEFRIWQNIHNLKILQRSAIVNDYEKVDIDVTQNFINEDVKERLFDFFDSKKEVTQQNIFDVINQNKESNILKTETHRINMFFDSDKKLDGNETKEYFRRIFRKKECNYEEEGEKILANKELFYKLWNISYSISLNDEEKSKEAIVKALTNPNNKHNKEKRIVFNFPPNVVNAIASAPDIESSKKYAAYSSKAINKLLPLMRCGKYYDETLIAESVKERAEQIHSRLKDINFNQKRIHEIADDDVQKQLLKSFISKESFLKELNTYQACYLVFDRHSEKLGDRKYSSISEFNIMEQLPNNSLRNPVVEQVVREALFVVKDVWDKYGQPDEIHIEMGRDLKKNAKEREKITKNSAKNYDEKQQIKKILYELLNDGIEQYVNVDDDIVRTKIVSTKFEVKPNPNNPSDIDRFKIWKSTSGLRDEDFDKKIKDEKIPKNQEIKKYVLWLSQKCVSPYTGRIIPLSKLFDQGQYEIEHILPKAKIKNDSFDNLVISERGVNKSKDKELAAVFIKYKNGVCEHQGVKYKLLEYSDYVAHCKRTFRGKKLQNLLADTIPEDFISRQINDTRYITKKISQLLYPVAKDKNNGIVFTIGAITSELKKEWGLQKEWKKIIKPRFERLEKVNNEKYILENKKDRNDIDFHIKENPDLDTKRIDHRHHALDAIIIAATTIEHIRYLNTLNATDTNKEWNEAKNRLVKRGIRDFELPWQSFTEEARKKIEQIIVTFKSYNKVIDKPKNQYSKWVLKEGVWIKDDKVKQVPNKKWFAVRQSLFAEQPHGKVYIKEVIEKSFETPKQMLEIFKLQLERDKVQNTPNQSNASYIYDKELREIVKQKINEFNGNEETILKNLKNYKPVNSKGELIKVAKIAVFNPYAAKRKGLNKDFDHKTIDKIPYADKSRIPQALHNHLLEYEQKKLEINKLVWSDGKLKRVINNVKSENILIDEAKKKLIKEAQSEAFSDEGLEALDKKVGMKIRKVTLKEDIGIKIPLANKLSQADGNPYFVIYENNITKERTGFSSLSSYQIIQRKNRGELILETKQGFTAILLQTNDLVYVPTKDEFEKIKKGVDINNAINWNNTSKVVQRIYVVNDFSEGTIYFRPNSFSKAIKAKELHTSYDYKCTNTIVTPAKDKNGNDILEEAVAIKDCCIKLRTDRLGNLIL